MSGTPTFGPYAPCDITLIRSMFLGSREIHAVSASRSKVMHTADFTPEGQVMGGRMRLAILRYGLSSVKAAGSDRLLPRVVWIV